MAILKYMQTIIPISNFVELAEQVSLAEISAMSLIQCCWIHDRKEI